MRWHRGSAELLLLLLMVMTSDLCMLNAVTIGVLQHVEYECRWRMIVVTAVLLVLLLQQLLCL